ncbi:MAG: globin [Acidimicrobiia bacterium]|nr:globin [Acidimicrobiia bacterium]
MSEQDSDAQPVTVYEAVGGADFFVALVEDFYSAVAEDPALRPSYPDDLSDAKRWLALFLIQYWGGPMTYSEHRGHPRLRMRHAPFVIGMVERNAWLGHMTTAVGRSGAPIEARRLLDQYFEQASLAMINQRL